MRIVLALILLVFGTVQARAETIAAVVNQDAISMSDFNARLDMILVSSGLPKNPEIRAKLAPQVIASLIEEQLKIQETKRLKIDVTQAEINEGFGQLAAQNKIPPENFRAMIEKSGIDIKTMESQIGAQIGWGKVIQKTMRPQVNISDSDIDDYIQRLRSNKGKTEYLLAEILLPIDAKRKDEEVRQLADKLAFEINRGAPFSKVAQQFSAAPGAANGGDRGWIQQGILSPELDNVVRRLEKGTISPPVKASDGYHILLLRDVRTISDESIPPRGEIEKILGIQRLERMQARALLDLKSSAFIDIRA